MTMLHYILEKPETLSDQVFLFAGNEENEKFLRFVFVEYNFDEFI